MSSPDLPAVEPRRRRCALFVDFDNVYIGLERLDTAAAAQFATDPAHWLTELSTGTDADGPFTRRFLVLACYLNPEPFSRFRPYFTRAGFRVVDCPSLTQQGKSSADINLVLDSIDAITASTRYDEFVIVSADADFTPLVQRLRADDRRVTIVTASPAASAYRAVADTVIGADAFAELVTTTANGAAETEQDAAQPVAATPKPRPAASASAPAGSPGPSSSSAAKRAVRQLVRAADRPVVLGAAAQAADQADPALRASSWAGARSFAAWLKASLPDLGVTTTRPPGFVWDPRRFDEDDLPGSAAPADSTALQRQVVTVTDVPGLSAADYEVLLTRLADDIAAHPFQRNDTARRVRDACQKAGAKVGRASVNFVISGILYAGTKLADAKPTKQQLAKAWAGNVVGLCRGARMELTKAEEKAIRTWVSGGLAS